MIPDRCSLGKGAIREGTAEFIARAGEEVVAIRDVPAYVCEECGEARYTAEVSRKIDAVMRGAHDRNLCAYPLPAGETSLDS
ncbi:MAG: type II toxin-antitoxin system MqsA family antitoxin [Methanospirillum sp.]